MIQLLVEFAILVVVFSVLYWLLEQLPLPGPIKKVVNIVLVVVAVVFLIYWLLQIPVLFGGAWPRWGH